MLEDHLKADRQTQLDIELLLDMIFITISLSTPNKERGFSSAMKQITRH